MAQQTEPVKRLVAIKLIKAGMDSKTVLSRFLDMQLIAEQLEYDYKRRKPVKLSRL